MDSLYEDFDLGTDDWMMDDDEFSFEKSKPTQKGMHLYCAAVLVMKNKINILV